MNKKSTLDKGDGCTVFFKVLRHKNSPSKYLNKNLVPKKKAFKNTFGGVGVGGEQALMTG